MLIKKKDLVVGEVNKNKGGIGICKTTNITDIDGLCGKGRLFGIQELEPGCSNGSHVHAGDFEIYQILQGKAEMTDDGEVIIVEPGDVIITHEGHEHSIKNIGTSTLKWIALILFV